MQAVGACLPAGGAQRAASDQARHGGNMPVTDAVLADGLRREIVGVIAGMVFAVDGR
jgi:hypothetical protein